MLGFETRRDPIRGEFAKHIREQLIRAHSMSDTAFGVVSPDHESSTKYHAVWR